MAFLFLSRPGNWTIYKGWDQMLALGHHLRDQFPGAIVPELRDPFSRPPSRFHRHMSARERQSGHVEARDRQRLEERRKQAEMYLQKLASTSLLQCDLLYAFFDFDLNRGAHRSPVSSPVIRKPFTPSPARRPPSSQLSYPSNRFPQSPERSDLSDPTEAAARALPVASGAAFSPSPSAVSLPVAIVPPHSSSSRIAGHADAQTQSLSLSLSLSPPIDAHAYVSSSLPHHTHPPNCSSASASASSSASSSSYVAFPATVPHVRYSESHSSLHLSRGTIANGGAVAAAVFAPSAPPNPFVPATYSSTFLPVSSPPVSRPSSSSASSSASASASLSAAVRTPHHTHAHTHASGSLVPPRVYNATEASALSPPSETPSPPFFARPPSASAVAAQMTEAHSVSHLPSSESVVFSLESSLLTSPELKSSLLTSQLRQQQARASSSDADTTVTTPPPSSSLLRHHTSHPHRFNVFISKFLVADSGHDHAKSFVIYTLDVREYFSLSDFIEWQVRKRFADFCGLREQLVGRFHDLPLPELPPKASEVLLFPRIVSV